MHFNIFYNFPEPDVGMEIDYKQSAAYQQGFHSGPLGFNARGYGANQPSRSAAVTTNAKTGKSMYEINVI